MASLRRLADALASTAHNRVELFGVELEEERVRLVALLVWSLAAAFLGMLAVGFITLTVVWFCPEEARKYVLAGFAVLYLGLFLTAAGVVRRQWQERPPPFAGTVAELKKDVAWIRSQD